MPKRKKQPAVVQDVMTKRRKTSEILEERLKVPTEDSSSFDAIVVPDTISSLQGKKRTPEAEAASNTALPDVATSLRPADIDADDDANANTDSVKDTQSNKDPRATDQSLSANTQEIKLEPVVKTETTPAPTNTSTSAREIKREPVVKTETTPAAVPAAAPADTSTDQAEAPIPTEPKRTFPWDLPAGEPNLRSPPPQAEDIVVTREPRVEEPLTATTDEAARKIAAPDISEGLPSPATPPSTATVKALTCRQTRRQTQFPPIETNEPQLDDDDDDADYVDDDALSGPAPSPTATMNTSIRGRSSRRVIPTRSTVTPVPPPNTATVNGSTRRQTRRQTQLPPIETREAQLDDDNANAAADDGDDDGDVSGQFWEGRLSANTPSMASKVVKRVSAWEDRLSELADYRKIYGHCNVPNRYSENTKLGKWVSIQRSTYKLHREGKTSPMTLSRIQQLESLGFEWDCSGPAWEVRLRELANYRKIHGHCNSPQNCSENTKLAQWVKTQRSTYKLHGEGKTSPMTSFRIKDLESLGFEWDCSGPAWEDRLSELANYRKIHGHCNVPIRYSENSKLGKWVSNQRSTYKLHGEGKTSPMTLSRIQALESLGFEWDCSGPRKSV
jgi:hypothetical protein